MMEIPMQLTINDKTIFFNVQYTKTKKINLDISPEGLITVKAPKNTDESTILDFIKANSKSLLSLQSRLENRKFVSNQKNYTETENFLYQGKVCTLSDILEIIPDTTEDIQTLLKKFYTKQTKSIVTQRVQHFEKIIGVKSKGIAIVDSPKTWGTCNSQKQLTFNYKLSMAPMSAIDSVVIHELCHILHLNHDRSFWRKVGAFDPNYKENLEYLDRFGVVMTI